MNKSNFVRQYRSNMGKVGIYLTFQFFYNIIDFTNDILQIIQIPVLFGNRLFPVPLIYI